jgi:hypothetical protein
MSVPAESYSEIAAPSFVRNPLVKLATARARGAMMIADKARVAVWALDMRVICHPSRLTD